MESIWVKSKKSIVLFFVITIIIWGLCLLINYSSVYMNGTFIIHFMEKKNKYNDCEITEFYNLGYKVVQYKAQDSIYYSEIVLSNKKISIVPYYKEDLGYYVNDNGIMVQIEDWEMLRHFPVVLKELTMDEYKFYMNVISELESK